jgi:hypothetical protein
MGDGIDVAVGVAVHIAVEYLIAGKGVGAFVEMEFGLAVPLHADNRNKTPTNIFIFFIIPSIR